VRRPVVLSLLAITLAAGCTRPSGDTRAGIGPPPGADRNPSAPVARVNGRPVTDAELTVAAEGPLAAIETKHAEEVHGLRVQMLDGLIEKRLLEERAAKEGTTVEALVQREITGKVPDPPEATLRAVYEQTKATKGSLPPFSEVRAEIATFVKSQTLQNVRQAYLARLRAEASVEILLPPLLPPRIDMKAEGPSRGNPAAPVTVVEFSDYECTFCSGAEATLKRVLDQYQGRVRLVLQNFPISSHPRAQKASEAALCAGEQGRYWDMHEKLFTNQQALSPENLEAYARELGVDQGAFRRCLDSGRMAGQVGKDRKTGESAGVNSTPTFFVNGRILVGAQPIERFREVIDYELSHPQR
jgi:protein-disulfide isomerase